MEVLDMDLRQQNQQTSRVTFKTIKKYSLFVCLVESSIIFIFLIYTLFPFSYNNKDIDRNYHKTPTLKQFSGGNDFISSNHKTYSNGVNTTKLLVGLVTGCNQRIHDLKFSIRCESKNTELCSLAKPALNSQENIKIESILKSPLVTMITTSKSGLRFSTQQVTMRQVRCKRDGTLPNGSSCRFKTKLYIYPNSKEQEIIGWGGALTDSTIQSILSLSTNGTIKILDEYFNGLMFNIIRISIGGTDFSSRFYTNDDLNSNNNDNGTKKDDWNLEKFSLKEEDMLYKIPMIKYIMKEHKVKDRELKLFASMWSPPTWMKTNEHFNKGYLKGSISDNLDKKTSDELYYKALAELKRKFLSTYLDNQIPIWGLTVMNEPIFAQQVFLDFNTIIMPRDDYANYVAKYLGPTIKDDERLKHIKLIVHDDNRRFLMNFTDPILSNPNVRQFVDGVSVHGYIDEDYNLMDEVYKKHKVGNPNFFILPTELCSGHLPFMEKALIGNWHRGIHYALDIIHSLQHSAAGWVDWNMVLDTSGGPGWLGGRLDSPIIVDKAKDMYYKSPMFYVLGHFSRYIPPHSFKLKTMLFNNHYDYRFETVTFLSPNGKDVVSVILNLNPYPIELNIRVLEREEIGIRTDEEEFQQLICRPESITTIIHSRNSE